MALRMAGVGRASDAPQACVNAVDMNAMERVLDCSFELKSQNGI